MSVTDAERRRLTYAAARLALGNLETHEVLKLAHELLDSGIYHDELIEIVDARPPRLDEVAPPLRKLLRRLDLDVPNSDAAVWEILDYHTSRIVDAQIDPIQALNELIRDVYWHYDFAARTRVYLGDSHWMEGLIGLYWSLDDDVGLGGDKPLADEILAKYRLSIREEAQDWRDRYARGRPEPTRSAD
jgi:hypothetical protein